MPKGIYKRKKNVAKQPNKRPGKIYRDRELINRQLRGEE